MLCHEKDKIVWSSPRLYYADLKASIFMYAEQYSWYIHIVICKLMFRSPTNVTESEHITL